MTLLGKIFTVLIFMMSLLFMAFSVMVFATHKNWKQVVLNTDSSAGPLGLKSQVEQKQQLIVEAKKELDEAENALARERAARRQAIAALQTKLRANETLLTQKETELAEKTAAHTLALLQVKGAQEHLTKLTTEVEQLRVDIRDVQKDRDDQFAKVVTVTDQYYEAEGSKARLEERQAQLLDQVSAMKKVLDRIGVDVETFDEENREPALDGVVTAVASNFVEISLGEDDGLRTNHELVVFRGRTYLGRVVVRKTAPNRSVAEFIKETIKGQIKRGDNVTTKLG